MFLLEEVREKDSQERWNPEFMVCIYNTFESFISMHYQFQCEF